MSTALFNERAGTHRCLRCGFIWTGRQSFKGSEALPVRCAGCRSPLWSTPRQAKNQFDALAVIHAWQMQGLNVRIQINGKNPFARPVEIFISREGQALAGAWGDRLLDVVVEAAVQMRRESERLSQKVEVPA